MKQFLADGQEAITGAIGYMVWRERQNCPRELGSPQNWRCSHEAGVLKWVAKHQRQLTLCSQSETGSEPPNTYTLYMIGLALVLR